MRNNVLSQALGRLFAVAENYPQLRASEGFVRLQDELSDIEEKIAVPRQVYNRNVPDVQQPHRRLPKRPGSQDIRLPRIGVLRRGRRRASGSAREFQPREGDDAAAGGSAGWLARGALCRTRPADSCLQPHRRQ